MTGIRVIDRTIIKKMMKKPALFIKGVGGHKNQELS